MTTTMNSITTAATTTDTHCPPRRRQELFPTQIHNAMMVDFDVERYPLAKRQQPSVLNEKKVTHNDGMRQCRSIDSLLELVEARRLLDNTRKDGKSELARQAHLHACEAGLDMVLEDHVVSMFAGCGLLQHSEQSFQKLDFRSEFAWTSLIQGSTDYGDSQNVFILYEKMQEDNVLPSTQTFVSLLKACAVLKCAERSREVHMDILGEGFEGDLFIGNVLLEAYCKAGLIAEAHDVFNELPARDVIAWTALLYGYTEMGRVVEALVCYEKMESDGVAPNPTTCVCALKACGILRAIDIGNEVHAAAVKYGFEGNTFVYSTIVDFYGKCDHCSEGQKVFDGASHRDVVSWTALIAGYAEHGYDTEVLHLLERMLADGISPNVATYACSLKSCGNVGSACKIQEVHSAVTKQGFDTHNCVGSALLDMYAKGGLLIEAKEVFDKLLIQDVVSWNTLMTAYSEHGFCEEVLRCYEDMKLNRMSPNVVTWACSLKACSTLGATNRLQDIHTAIIKEGMEKEPHVGSTLVDAYASCGQLTEARHISKELLLLEQNIAVWNSLMSGSAEFESGEYALECYQEMQFEGGVPPDAATFVSCLKACCRLGATDSGREMHSDVIKRGFEDVFTGRVLVDLYAKCGLLAEAQHVFNTLRVRDVVVWNTLLQRYAGNGVTEVLVILEELESEWNAETFACCLKACSSAGFFVRGQEIHAKLVKGGYEASLLVGNLLVELYAKWGSIIEAKKVFEDLHARDVVSWTTLASGLSDCGLAEEAQDLIEKMQTEGMPYNPLDQVFSLKAFGNLGAVGRGYHMHDHLVKWGYEAELSVTSLLMDMYSKCGSVAEVQNAFDRLPVKDLVSWTALLSCYARLGHTEKALDCLDQMQLEGVIPDTVTFALCFKACSTSGGKERGQELHAEMVKRGLDHDFPCNDSLLSMYIKCGLLIDAQSIFDTLPSRDVFLWNALLIGYVEHGMGEEALACYDHMQRECVSPDAITAISTLKACGTIGALDMGRQRHLMGTKVGHGLSEMQLYETKVGTALVDMYTKSGSMLDAQKVFDTMERKEIIAWNALISGYTRQGESARVFDLADSMIDEGICPDGITYLFVLTACSHAGLAEKGEAYFRRMKGENHVIPVIHHFSCIVDLFCRVGRLEETVAIIESTYMKLDFVLLSTILSGCQKRSSIEVGRWAFEHLVLLDQCHTAAPFVLMLNTYTGASVEED